MIASVSKVSTSVIIGTWVNLLINGLRFHDVSLGLLKKMRDMMKNHDFSPFTLKF